MGYISRVPFRDHGYGVNTMSNGDKIYIWNSGTSTVRGQGKPDGAATFDIDGEYTL